MLPELFEFITPQLIMFLSMAASLLTIGCALYVARKKPSTLESKDVKQLVGLVERMITPQQTPNAGVSIIEIDESKYKPTKEDLELINRLRKNLEGD